MCVFPSVRVPLMTDPSALETAARALVIRWDSGTLADLSKGFHDLRAALDAEPVGVVGEFAPAQLDEWARNMCGCLTCTAVPRGGKCSHAEGVKAKVRKAHAAGEAAAMGKVRGHAADTVSEFEALIVSDPTCALQYRVCIDDLQTFLAKLPTDEGTDEAVEERRAHRNEGRVPCPSTK